MLDDLQFGFLVFFPYLNVILSIIVSIIRFGSEKWSRIFFYIFFIPLYVFACYFAVPYSSLLLCLSISIICIVLFRVLLLVQSSISKQTRNSAGYTPILGAIIILGPLLLKDVILHALVFMFHTQNQKEGSTSFPLLPFVLIDAVLGRLHTPEISRF